MQKRTLSIAAMTLMIMSFVGDITLGQSGVTQQRPTVIVKIKNGKPLRGTLLREDNDSVRMEIDGVSCPVEIDKEEVASIVFSSEDGANKGVQSASRRSIETVHGALASNEKQSKQ